MRLDVTTESLVALQHHMIALSSHIAVLVLESSLRKGYCLGEQGWVLDRVSMFFDQLVDELKPSNGLLRLRCSFNRHLSCVREDEGPADEATG